MKKTWKTREEDSGVSPVIATILMVAITVVLAAVLYVMVVGITPPEDVAPAGSLTFDVEDTTSARINFGTFSPTPAPMDIKVIVTNTSDAADVVELSFAVAPNAATVEMTASNGATATYTDMNYIGNAINSGDFISVSGLHAKTTYEVKLFHYGTQSVCTLIGDRDFNLP
jgi:flagellin-like protein